MYYAGNNEVGSHYSHYYYKNCNERNILNEYRESRIELTKTRCVNNMFKRLVKKKVYTNEVHSLGERITCMKKNKSDRTAIKTMSNLMVDKIVDSKATLNKAIDRKMNIDTVINEYYHINPRAIINMKKNVAKEVSQLWDTLKIKYNNKCRHRI